ncbi:TPA: DUF4917 family protein [Klebsiella quasipneumoniae subsp. similipneumoniae]|nr:DUF4917 family protein [Klebsiella quasipneumoniae subsp. similipneumoniae]HBS2794035.1 DUF4917 family protein [Klebsiella quasipneumoniae subsp. similipneumoniae]HBS2808817.1 DUF4917 family protein [Klebsiella quasipneumoniae subsp. similipneumoniae]HCA4371198.1 DUF4917 family protein [Klebsiella quasipneumoniae subsp. similipneumoniae]
MKNAMSVFGGDQAYCNRIFQIIHDVLGAHIAVEFFNSESPGCWIHPPHQEPRPAG